MGDNFDIPLPRDIARGRVTPRPAPASSAGTKKPGKKKGKASKPKTVDLKAWVATFNLGGSYGVPSPIWHESGGFHASGIFQYTNRLNRFGIGLEYEKRWTHRPLTPTDRLSDVKGESHTGYLVLQKETFSSSLISTSNAMMIGYGKYLTPHQTIKTQDGDPVTVDRKSKDGWTFTKLMGVNIHAVTNWLSFSPFIGISVTDAKGDDFDGMRLLLGLNVRFSLGPKNTTTVSTEEKHKPGWFVFIHDLASKAFGLTQQYFTSRLSVDYEDSQHDVDMSGGAPGNLIYLTPIKLINDTLTMYGQGGEMESYLAYDDRKGWAYLAAMGAGVPYLFAKSTASKTIGISSLAQVARMLIFMPLRTPSQRRALIKKKKIKKEAFKALMGSFALDLGASLLGSIIIGAGKNTELSRGMLFGSTLSQGGLTFTKIPGIESSTAAEYMLFGYFGSDGTKGLLGGVLLRKHFKGLNIGLETLIASAVLAGAHMRKGGKFVEKEPPSFICTSPGLQFNKKNWHLHVGPNQCFREGGSDGVTGSIGVQLSAGVHFLLGKVLGTKISLTGSVTASGGWNVGGTRPGTPRNSGYGTVGGALGFEFE